LADGKWQAIEKGKAKTLRVDKRDVWSSRINNYNLLQLSFSVSEFTEAP
jgi:hypothetical protein